MGNLKMGCFCSSQSPADFDGIKEYSQQNQATILELINKDNKEELKIQFGLGWRTHHGLLKKKDTGRRYLHVLQEKDKFSLMSDIPITMDTDSLLANGPEDKKMYTYLLTNIVVLRNIHSSLSSMENIDIKVKSVINPEILEFMNTNKPEKSEKEGDENYAMYKYLMENIFKKAEEKPVEQKPAEQETDKKKDEEQKETEKKTDEPAQ